MDVTYVLPLRRTTTADNAELTQYLRWISERAELIVVDGSPADVFAHHAAMWQTFAHHVPADANQPGRNGKVIGVLTGVRHASHEMLILADDDVRYDRHTLAAVVDALATAEIVRPQNFFAPLPWHAAWDTGRILLNRAIGGDWPGTLAVRRSAVRATNGYTSDVLFENLELVRTIVAAGGRERLAREILVRRLPASAAHFGGQRVRQAYDELARPLRLVIQLASLPLLVLLIHRHRFTSIAVVALLLVVIAEWGRRRAGGSRVFPFVGTLYAPVWALERAVCIWLALASRVLRSGMPYAGHVVVRAATPVRILRARHAGSITITSIGLNDPLLDNSAEQAVTPTIRSISARTTR